MNKSVTQPLKAFLCHASGDKPAVREMYKRLVFEGVDAWLDKEKLLPGQDWRVEIPRAVQEADVVIVFLSKKSVSKEGYVQKEIKFALDIAEEKPEGTIFLIPARLEDCLVPERLSRWQWVDLFDDNGFVQLLRSLKLRARAVGATVEPASYEDTDRETAQRVEQLYTEGLAAFYTEDWDRACQRFHTILSEQPGHKNAAEKLAEAEKQRSLTRLYAQAEREYKAENWQAVIQSLEELLGQVSEYKDAEQLLKNAKRKKRLGELYVEAKALHMAQKWQAVTKVFEQIAAIDPTCPDPDNLLSSAQKEVAELKRIADLNDQYSLAVRRMDSGQWLEARTLLEKVHKSQTGFLETERLLRKAEDEITKVEEQNKRRDQVNLLYEQAHGLIRSKNWRQALSKMEEVQQLGSQFEDKDGITEQAKAELAREEQEIQRQNELAAMYAESVRLMQGGQYQDALDKWGEVKAVDPKYPDRQWVQRTAKKKLAEMTKPVKIKPRLVIKKSLWKRMAVFVVVAVGIIGVVLLVKFGHWRYILYDEFSSPQFNGRYDTTKWNITTASGSKIFQEGGLLVVEYRGPQKGFNFGAPSLNAASLFPVNKYSYMEIKMMVKDEANKGSISIQFWTDKTYFVCGLDGNSGGLKKECWREDTGSSGGNYRTLASYSIAANKSYVFVVRVDPFDRIINFYFDKQNVASYPLADSETLPAGFNIGCWVASDSIFQGYIDYVKLYTSDE